MTAVETAVLDACPQTRPIVQAAELPPLSALASSLASELDALDAPLVLVLDDYHRPGVNSGVQALLRQLLAHPPGYPQAKPAE